jgi:hypothetical protein
MANYPYIYTFSHGDTRRFRPPYGGTFCASPFCVYCLCAECLTPLGEGYHADR